jgi:hypothetical protein
MAYENSAGLGVYNQYGARQTGGAVGQEHVKGSKKVLRIDLTGDSINDAVGGFVPPVKIPKGANFHSAVLRVDEAFTVTGTSPVVNIGSAGSVATNGVTITETELENVGTKEIASTGNGTWSFSSSTGLTAAALVGFALGGTSPVVARGAGKATLILEYTDVAKA